MSRSIQTACLVFKQSTAVAKGGGPQTHSPAASIIVHPALSDFRQNEVSNNKGHVRGAHLRRTEGNGRRFGIDASAAVSKKKGAVRKGRGMIAASSAQVQVGAEASIQDLKLVPRGVADLMSDRRLSRLPRFKNVDFGLVPTGKWWCSATFADDHESRRATHKRGRSEHSNGATQHQQKRALGKSMTSPNDTGASPADHPFFAFDQGVSRVTHFVKWLATRKERHVSIVTDHNVIRCLLELRYRNRAKRGNAKRRLSRQMSWTMRRKSQAQNMEILSDMLEDVYDCCQSYQCFGYEDVLLEKCVVLEKMSVLQTQWWQKEAWVFTRDQSMSTLLKRRLLQAPVSGGTRRDHSIVATSFHKRSESHPELVDVAHDVLTPVAEKSLGEQCAVNAAKRLASILGYSRAADVRRDLWDLFREVDRAVNANRTKLSNLHQQGKQQFRDLENAMAGIWSEVADVDLIEIRSEKYIPDLLRDVFGGVMILFGCTDSQTFDTPDIQRFFGRPNIRDRIANCDFANPNRWHALSPVRGGNGRAQAPSHKFETLGQDDEVVGIMRILFGDEEGAQYEAMKSMHRPSKRVHRLIGSYLKERWISFDERNLTSMLDRRNLPHFSCAIPIAKWVSAVYDFWLAVPGFIVEILTLEKNTYTLHEEQVAILSHFVEYSTRDDNGKFCEPQQADIYENMQAVMRAHAEEESALEELLHPLLNLDVPENETELLEKEWCEQENAELVGGLLTLLEGAEAVATTKATVTSASTTSNQAGAVQSEKSGLHPHVGVVENVNNESVGTIMGKDLVRPQKTKNDVVFI